MPMKTAVSPMTIILASSSPRRQELVGMLGLPVRIRPSDADENTPDGWTPERIVEELAHRKAMAVWKASQDGAEQGVVVGSDTLVALDGRILGKPEDEAHAAEMLRTLSGRTHEVYTGLCCIGPDHAAGSDGEPKVTVGHTVSKVTFKPMSEEEIRAYVKTGDPLDKAGGYDTTMHLGDIGQYRILSESPDGRPEIIVGHTVSKVTFRPMSDEEIWAYVKTGDPLDKAGAYGVQGIGSVFIEKIEGDFYSIMGLPLNLLYQMLLMFGISLFNQS